MSYQSSIYFLRPLDSLQNYFSYLVISFLNFFVNFLIALIVFVIGWLVAAVVRHLILELFQRINFRELLKSAGLDKYFENFVWEERFERVVSEIVFWLIIVVFLMTSFDILGFQVVNSFIQQVTNYLPRAVSGALILVFGFVFGELARKFFLGILHGLERKSARAIASVMKWVIVIFAFLVALNQWGVESDIINIVVTGIVLFIAIAGGLAFGLGGQDLARELLEDWKRKFE